MTLSFITAGGTLPCTAMDTNTIDFIAQDLTRKYIILRAANRRLPPSTASGSSSSSSSSSSGPSTNDLARSLQRMLQVSPGMAVPPLQPQTPAVQNQFLNQLQTVNWEVARYENRVLLVSLQVSARPTGAQPFIHYSIFCATCTFDTFTQSG